MLWARGMGDVCMREAGLLMDVLLCVVRDVLSNEQAAHLVVNHAPSPSPHDNHPHEALEVSTEASIYRHSETCRHRHRYRHRHRDTYRHIR